MEETKGTTMPDGHQETVNRVRNAMARRGMTQTDVSRQTGIGASVVSAVLSGTYRGRREEVACKLDRWAMGLDVADRLNVGVDRARVFVETPTSLRIEDVCTFTKARGIVGLVAGATGIGKSMTLKQFAGRNPAVWYCEFSRDHDTIPKVLRHIAEAVGVYMQSTRGTSPTRLIADRIRRTRGLLILDEAQHLSKDGLETARSIFDFSEDDEWRTVGLLLAGHLDLAEKVARLDHLEGRVGRRLVLPSAIEADADALADYWEVTCPRAREFLRSRARDRSGLRRIAKTYELALTLAMRDGSAVAYDHVRGAWAAFSGSAAN